MPLFFLFIIFTSPGTLHLLLHVLSVLQEYSTNERNSVACLDRFAGFLFTASLLARGARHSGRATGRVTPRRRQGPRAHERSSTSCSRPVRILRALQFEQKYRSKWRQVERASTDAATRLRDLHSFANRSRTSAAPSLLHCFWAVRTRRRPWTAHTHRGGIQSIINWHGRVSVVSMSRSPSQAAEPLQRHQFSPMGQRTQLGEWAGQRNSVTLSFGIEWISFASDGL
jgi:hypothetical protein